ncbi:hypothetical protein niasHS_006096 [Heterodera schachtii]|uniref:Uncharacterized protein n=1 Tax=Heterodera schachtii TaxID=97005 RepID=A0ABD2JVY1_HETSC
MPFLSVVLPIFFSALLFVSATPKTEFKFFHGAEDDTSKNQLAALSAKGYEVVASAQISEPGSPSRKFMWTLEKNEAKNAMFKNLKHFLGNEKKQPLTILVNIERKMDDILRLLNKK